MKAGSKDPDQKKDIDTVLQDYEMRYRIMAESTTLGMFRLTPAPESRIISTNQVMARMLGYNRPEDLTGKTLDDMVIVPAVIEDLAAGIRDGGSFTGREVLLKQRDGSGIWASVQAWKLETRGSPVTDD